MGRFERRIWEPTDTSIGLPRAYRRGGTYDAFIPERLAERTFALGAAGADVEEAAVAVARLDATQRVLTRTESLARLLLRAEAVASSRIEGLEINARRLLHAAVDRTVRDEPATEILANIDAMAYAVDEIAAPVTIARLLELHRRLLGATRLAQHAGDVRTVQNWIGGNPYNPIGAAFVPPPPEAVPALLADLEAFCARTDLPVIAQAAIAHAQYETIHPHVDGNGRVGRALIAMVLGARGLVARVVPPISLVLATQSRAYVAALDALRTEDDDAAWERWIGMFAAAARTAVARAEQFESVVASLQASWRERIAARRGSAALLILERLPEMPVLTVAGAAAMLDRGTMAVNGAVNALVAAGILTPLKAGKRNRVFEARELVDAFTGFERSLATAGGDTRIERPARRVPARPKHPPRGRS